jgi:hypothetical protein
MQVGCADALIDTGDGGDTSPVDMRVFDALRFDTGDPQPRIDASLPLRDAAVNPDRDQGPITDADLSRLDARPPPADGNVPDARPDAAPPGEACDGLDDDADGEVDEDGACGPYIQQSCVAWLVWGQGLNRFAPSQTWGACPAEDRDRETPDARCAGTRGDGAFARLNLPLALDAGGQLGVAFTCSDAAAPALAAYIQTHCSVFLGWDGNNRAVDGAAEWGACPASASASSGPIRCVSSARDPAGRFLALPFDAPVGLDHGLGLAWICQDDADPARAENLNESAELGLGFAPNNQGPLDGNASWGPCPGATEGEAGGQRCALTLGDGHFRRMRLGAVPAANSNLGIALRARRP